MVSLRKMYESLGRIANVCLRGPLFLWLSRSTRVRVLVLSDDGHILLVRSWLGFQNWSLPGGGMHAGETPAHVASRELFEETGFTIHEMQFQQLGTFINTDSAISFRVNCQVAIVAKHRPPYIAPRWRHEILDAAWFQADELPVLRSHNVDEALQLYKELKIQDGGRA